MFDTIAGIATAPGNGGIGIVRISGKESISIANKVFRSPSGKLNLNNVNSHTVHYGNIFDDNNLIDEVLVTVFLSPKSFTTEDVVEISCHGGLYVTKKILEVVLKNGARLAERGEFTKRAFLNGRIDLSQAEAVIDIINSKNEFSLKNSVKQLSGSIKNKIIELRNDILHEVAYIESALDDPEHYSLEGYYDKLNNIVINIEKKLNKILRDSKNGLLIKNGINTVIIGKPNAGKSSLLNYLLDFDRAIVTEIAGTTRDSLEETISISGLTLNIIDTAGIRETEDIIEKIGVDKALDYASDADLILYVIDSSVNLDDDDFNIINHIKSKNVIVILNKSDLSQKVSKETIIEYLNVPIIDLSAKELFGKDDLINLIEKMFIDGDISFDEDLYITNERQIELINLSINSIRLVIQGIEENMPEDCITIDLMDVYKYLGDIIGESISDDLADKIFSEFCMGK